MNEVLESIKFILSNKMVYIKRLSQNDVGENGAHQAGFLISKKAKSMFFDNELPKSGILDKWIPIHWHNFDITTNSRVVFYSSKHEIRITNFAKGFPLLRPSQAGSLLIIAKNTSSTYEAMIVTEPKEIDSLVYCFGLAKESINNYLEISID